MKVSTLLKTVFTLVVGSLVSLSHAQVPVVTTQPVSVSVVLNSPATFSVSATGAALRYQWYFGSPPSGVPVSWGSGATTAVLTTLPAISGIAGNYYAEVSNASGSVFSNVAQLTVTAPAGAPTITTQPYGSTVATTDPAYFSVEAISNSAMTFQWRKDGVAISGATSAQYTIASTIPTDAGTYTVVITNSSGSTTSAPRTLTLLPGTAPSFIIPIQAMMTGSGRVGDSVTLSIITSGRGLFFQWFKDGVSIPGANAESFTLSRAQIADTGAYSIKATNANGTATSSSFQLTILPQLVAPIITAQTSSRSVDIGSDVTLTVTAGGTGPLTYQWNKNFVPISGATAATYSILSMQFSDGGTYTVTVTNSVGSVTSAEISLSPIAVVVAPFIQVPPQSVSGVVGQSISFSVTAIGTAPLTYRWSKDGNAISGAAAASFSIPSLQMTDAGSYSVLVTNSAGSVTSFAATLTVNAALAGPTIVTQPAAQVVAGGGSAMFSVAATGTAPITYQWRLDGTPIPGANSSSYTLPAVQAGQTGTYTVVVTNTAGSVTSNPVTLSINTAAGTAPTITTQSTNQTVNAGSAVTFSVAATGTAPLAYQWRLDGIPIPGGTSSTYTLAAAQTGHSGAYSVVVSNAAGSVTSNTATLTVNAAIAPAITTQPAAQTVTAGSAAAFSGTATGTAPLAYQWLKNGVPISGATAATYTLVAAQLTDAGTYQLVVTNGVGSISSNGVSLTVNSAPVAPVITTQPAAQSVLAGASATFSVVATGTAPLVYQWRKNGVVIPSATSSTLVLASITSADAAEYTVIVSNAAGIVTSSGAVLSLATSSFGTPSITAQPAGVTASAGATATFTSTVNLNGAPEMLYYWVKDGRPLSARISSTNGTVTLNLSNVQSSDQGEYVLDVTTAGGAVRSAVARFTLVRAPVFTSQPQTTTVVQNSPASLSVSVAGEPTPTLQWFQNNVAVPGATSGVLSIASTQVANAGAYTVVATSSAGTATSSPGTLSVLAITGSSQTGSSLVGGEVALSVSAVGPSLAYQWLKNGVNIPGATGATLTLRSLTSADAGGYQVFVTSGSVQTGASFVVSVSAVPVAPAVVTQPASQTVSAGSSVVFSAAASGTAPFSYQWLKDGTPISGATGSSLTLSNVQTGDAGGYRIVFSNSVGTVTSAVATLSITSVAAPPVITAQPLPQSVAISSPVTFSVSATGTAPLAYQWLRNGAAITGANSAAYTIASAQLTDAANYSVSVTNSAGSVTSSVVALTVTALNYSGTYFGQFSGNPADRFALVIRPDGTALFLGYASSQTTGYTATNVRINPDGTFTADLTVIAANAPAGDARPGADNPPGTAATTRSLNGSVATGALIGSIAGTSLTVAASKSPATGSAQTAAGVYQANAINRSNGGITTVVDATGQAFVFSQTATGVTAGTGTFNPATGQVATTLADNSLVTATLNPAAGSATATVTTAAKETITFAGLAEGVARSDRLANIASRGPVTSSELMIAGFVIVGSAPKTVLIRATGPALTAFGLGGVLPNPKLELFRDRDKFLENDDWSLAANAPAISAAAARTGAFALSAGSRDAAILTTLPPGGYTAQVSSVTGQTGVGLVEVYDADETAVTSATPRLVGISIRAGVAGGESLLIAGIVITGNAPKRILIRATGPALTAFGVPNALSDPLLRLYQGTTVLQENDNWSASATEAALISAAGNNAGAFPLVSGTKDAALLVTLMPGNYTAQVSGVGNAVGAALVEVYEAP